MSGAAGEISPVLHVISCLDVGGAERALQRLVLADPRPPERHVVVSLRELGVIGAELRAAGVTVHALGMSSSGVNLIAFARLVRLISRTRPAVVQTWMYHGDFFGGLAARLAGCREVVWGIHNAQFLSGHSRITLAVMRACARLSGWVPRVIVCCAEAARVSHVGWGYRSDIMRVIPNGFIVPDLQAAYAGREALRQKLGFAPDDIVVGMVARYDPIKGHRGFIEAAGEVTRKAGRAVRFMLVGRGVEPTNDALMGWIRAAGVEDRCVLLGERRDVQDCMAAMDLYCLASIHEAFPMVVGEAMAMALPCVVTDVGDAARMVGECGQVVPPRDSTELAAAIASMAALPERQRQAMGLAARRRIEAEFSLEHTRSLIEQVYRQACIPVGGSAR